jgi:acyl-CoA hydrolase
MTACLDAMDFYSPVRARELLTFKAGLNHVGTTSMEIGVKVLAENPRTGEVRHTCTAYLTFVHLGLDRRPRPVPPFTPDSPGEKRRWDAAMVRREARLARVKRLKASLQREEE